MLLKTTRLGSANMYENVYKEYVAILEEELVPAMGCTEPIAIAYAAAKARDVLGVFPEKLTVRCSANIIKNAMGVIVPGTVDMKGVETAAIIGLVGGMADRGLEALQGITDEHIVRTKELINQDFCDVLLLEGDANLHIIVEVYGDGQRALVEIENSHTNIVRIEKDGTVLRSCEDVISRTGKTDRSLLNMEDIYTFIQEFNIEDLKEVLDRQMEYNRDISRVGLENPYGVNVGKTLLKIYGDDVAIKAKAYPAAGSDARMGGCPLPVVTNSGSGNQGMTISLPVLVYAEHLKVSDEIKYRALTLANLIGIYQKNGLGKLSGYCGAVSAACGAGAGITYMHGGDYDAICRTIINTLGNVSGIVCDGAKPSCAAKIASAVDAAILAHTMSMQGDVFHAGDGIIMEDIESTLRSIWRVGREGMKSTDIEILNIMIGQ